MRVKPKVKMYIEIKPGQEDKVTIGNYKRNVIDIILPNKQFIRCHAWHGAPIDNTIDFLRSKGLEVYAHSIDETKKYRTIRGHKFKRLGKHELIVPVSAVDLESALEEVKKVEQELRNLGIKYERKCTWVCGM